MLGKRLDYQVEENKIHFFFEKEAAFLPLQHGYRNSTF